MRIGIDPHQVAWAAGFFDGEGNVCLSRSERRTPRLIVQIAQVHRSPLDRFARIVGFGKVHGPYVPRTPKSSPYYRWAVEGLEPTEAIFTLLAPYLDAQKTRSFSTALDEYRAWMANPRCSAGHQGEMKVGKRGRIYCPECRVESGRKAAAARWLQ